MAYKYRDNRDSKVDLKRTQSSTSDDPTLNKARQISRRNDDVKNMYKMTTIIYLIWERFFYPYSILEFSNQAACRCGNLEEYYELDNKIPIMFIDNSACVNFHYRLART